MFTKLEQSSWIKMKEARCRSTQECFQRPHEVLRGKEPHHSSRQYKESHYCCCLELLRRWQREILEYPPYSLDMSPCDYNLFANVKEPLRGIRYNTRDELIRAIERSIRNIYKD